MLGRLLARASSWPAWRGVRSPSSRSPDKEDDDDDAADVKVHRRVSVERPRTPEASVSLDSSIVLLDALAPFAPDVSLPGLQNLRKSVILTYCSRTMSLIICSHLLPSTSADAADVFDERAYIASSAEPPSPNRANVDAFVKRVVRKARYDPLSVLVCSVALFRRVTRVLPVRRHNWRLLILMTIHLVQKFIDDHFLFNGDVEELFRHAVDDATCSVPIARVALMEILIIKAVNFRVFSFEDSNTEYMKLFDECV